ncbi:MAG: CrcB family protein [Geminicoccaceae bacterium]|nr:CrcB family protein [Geminicoccaceae bacterium]MCS7268407.1 CrcB family protein [Geminicoccaceae bacterium]MCX7629469.1 CrcB family protein [Geminicoccaceae bacterium]MDW8124300.1 CrcB family protein [Geminicoccaceae bacterium]MDW8342187.1 CrcB family protein [Geminicoccaceae bacterium]
MLELPSLIVGCFLGGIARYAVSGAVARRIGETFPWGTLVVNLSGAFAIGLLARAPVLGDAGARAALLTGFLGCYTTVSSLALQTLFLWRAREWKRALLNLSGSALLGFAACGLGLALGERLW